MSCKEEIAPVEEGNDHPSVEIHKLVQSSLAPTTLEEKFKQLEPFLHDDQAVADNTSPKPKPKPLIQRAPFMLRDNNNFDKYCQPRAVSIGPLHHGNSKFKKSSQFKDKLAAYFIKENGLKEKDLYEKIKNEIGSLRKCYGEDEIKSFNDEDLSWVLFVDGCALLHYIDCVAKNKLNELKIKNYHAAFAGQDLFLLENQLPYKLLKILMESCNNGPCNNGLEKSISSFIFETVEQIRGFEVEKHKLKVEEKNISEDEEPTHLLELLWEQLVGKTEQREPKAGDPTHRLERLCKRPVGKTDQPLQAEKKGQQKHQWYSFRNVNELRAAGIDLQSAKKGSLHDISFTSDWFTGTLTLPSIIVDDSTAPRFLNLIAYEMCPDFDNDFEITSYIIFLYSLIDQPSDVKELRNAHILRNHLGSDEEVAKLFNEIGIDLVPNPEAYKKIMGDIQNHYEKKWNTWCAQFLHDHFSSPWTVLAFLGAIAALLLSALQTVYSMK